MDFSFHNSFSIQDLVAATQTNKKAPVSEKKG